MARIWVGLALVAGIGLIIIVSKATRETDEEYAARRNLEILDAIELAWETQRERPIDPQGLADPSHFEPFIADLRAIYLDEATPEVKAVHASFMQLAADAPTFMEKLTEGPPEEERVPGTRLRPANEEWLLRVRNAGIQLEVKLRKINEEITRLRDEYGAIAK